MVAEVVGVDVKELVTVDVNDVVTVVDVVADVVTVDV